MVQAIRTTQPLATKATQSQPRPRIHGPHAQGALRRACIALRAREYATSSSRELAPTHRPCPCSTRRFCRPSPPLKARRVSLAEIARLNDSRSFESARRWSSSSLLNTLEPWRWLHTKSPRDRRRAPTRRPTLRARAMRRPRSSTSPSPSRRARPLRRRPRRRSDAGGCRSARRGTTGRWASTRSLPPRCAWLSLARCSSSWPSSTACRSSGAHATRRRSR